MIKIKCDYVGGAVAVPTNLIDKHLKLAPSASFKVLLFLLRNPDGAADFKQISSCTGLSESDTKSCVQYWEQYGVIETTALIDEASAEKAQGNLKSVYSEKNAPGASELSTTTATAAAPKREVRTLPVKKPTAREIATRLSEEPELSTVYTEAQMILGTFGYDTQALLLMIYDYYGFPPEVILTLLQCQKNEGRASSAAIKNRAEDWAKRGIDTLELVEKELSALENIKKAYIEIKASADLVQETPTPKIAKFLRDWAVEWEVTPALMRYALKECGNSFSEANKLIKKYVNSGIKTPEEAEKKSKKSIATTQKKSYDTEKIGKNSVLDWVKRYADENGGEG